MNVSLSKSFHELTAATGAVGRQQQMHVVGLAATGVDGAPCCARVRIQVLQVEPVDGHCGTRWSVPVGAVVCPRLIWPLQAGFC